MFSRTRGSNGMRRPNDSVPMIFSGGVPAASTLAVGAKVRPSPAAAEPRNQSRRVALLMSIHPSSHPVLVQGIVVQRYAQPRLLRDMVKAVLHRECFFDQ